MTISWNGVFPALLTPFTEAEELDLAMFGKNLEAQLDAGVNGVIIGGSLGEASSLTLGEKEKLVKCAVEVADGSIPVLLNIAEGSTREAARQTSLAMKWGARGLMLLPPMRYKSDERETVIFFKAVAGSTDLPIMIYNNPVDYKIEVTLDMFEELADCPNIQAVKESTRDVSNVTRMLSRFGNRYRILCGVDTIIVEELLMGANGWVAGLVDAFPKETVAIYRLIKCGRTEEARAIFQWFLPMLELDLHPKLVQYIKLAAAQTGLSSEWVRSPRLPIVGEERKRILDTVTRGIKTRPRLPDYLSIPA